MTQTRIIALLDDSSGGFIFPNHSGNGSLRSPSYIISEFNVFNGFKHKFNGSSATYARRVVAGKTLSIYASVSRVKSNSCRKDGLKKRGRPSFAGSGISHDKYALVTRSRHSDNVTLSTVSDKGSK
jgi:hypothetical protein